MIEYNEKKYVCYLDLAMDIIRSKWKAVILCHLSDGPKRYLALQRITKGISHKVLSESLKQLEADGLITKNTYPESPPRVEFELTQMGKELSPALKIIEEWGKKYFENTCKI